MCEFYRKSKVEDANKQSPEKNIVWSCEGGRRMVTGGHETKVVHEEEKLGLCSSAAKGGNGFWIFHNNFPVGFE